MDLVDHIAQHEELGIRGDAVFNSSIEVLGTNTLGGEEAADSLATGTDNTLIGYQAGNNVTIGSSNVAIGSGALANTTTETDAPSHDLVAIGKDVLKGGEWNERTVCIGSGAGAGSGGHYDLTLIGVGAGAGAVASSACTIIGNDVCKNTTTLTDVVVIGENIGDRWSEMMDVVVIGHSSGPDQGSTGLERIVAIGTYAKVNASYRWCIGGQSTFQQVYSGRNQPMGLATLVAGQVTVPHSGVTADSVIFLTVQSSTGDASTHGAVYVSARVPGTSFTIKSTNPADVSVVAWEIKQPFTYP